MSEHVQDSDEVRVAKMKEYDRLIETTDGAERDRHMVEAMDYVRSQGLKVDVDDLMKMVEFTTRMIDSFLRAIILTANGLGATEIPVSFVEELRGMAGQHIHASVFGAADTLGVPLDYGVPDDISGLEGF